MCQKEMPGVGQLNFVDRYIAKGLKTEGQKHHKRLRTHKQWKITKHIQYLTWDIEDPLSAKLVWSKMLLCKTCCNMAKIAHIVNQIRFFQPLPNPMNHKHQMSNRNLQTTIVMKLISSKGEGGDSYTVIKFSCLN